MKSYRGIGVFKGLGAPFPGMVTNAQTAAYQGDVNSPGYTPPFIAMPGIVLDSPTIDLSGISEPTDAQISANMPSAGPWGTVALWVGGAIVVGLFLTALSGKKS